MFRRFFALAAALCFPVVTRADVVITEIHYHPVERPEFNADGTPSIDLSNDVFEFVEIQNTGSADVDLSGWSLAGGIDFLFPAQTTLGAGGYRVIAKDPIRLAAVYNLDGSAVLGPYDRNLGNRSDTVRLRDASGRLVDAVTYDSRFPWPQSADALGAQDRFLGLDSRDFQYKGRSLQRVSAAWPSGDPANWLASPLSGPTPGAPQAVTRAVPRPVVVSFSASQASDGAAVVRPNETVRVECSFSGTDNLSGVTLEFFVDDVNGGSKTRNNFVMTGHGGGRFSALLPGQPGRSIVRYRFKANRGSGLEVVSPRPDDPQIAPVGPNRSREAWHGYFVTPVRTTSNAAVYDVFVSSADLSTMAMNIVQDPRRVTAASATGLPRAVPWVAGSAPQWNGTVPGVFAADGQVWDVHIRYHGSRYHRAPSHHSYKLHFPENKPFNGQTAWFQTLHGQEFIEAQRLMRLAGLPASKMRRVDWYLNNAPNEVHSEQGEYAGEMLDEYHALRQQLDPGSEKEPNGELYKVVGNRDRDQNNGEGPYTRGTSAPMLANAGWSQLERYDWNYSLQNNAWKGPGPIRDMVEGMWAARGDTMATHNFAQDPTKLARARQWFLENWDMDSLLTSMALLQWMSVWDDACQNHFFWRRANGKWSRLGWDYDAVMTFSGPGGQGGPTQSLYGGEYGSLVFDGVNWWKDTFFKCFRSEFNRRLWELNNSFLDPVNLTELGLPQAATFAGSRRTYVNSQLSNLGTYHKPNRPANVAPANGAALVGPASLTTSAYSHPRSTAHASTRWELRSSEGDYEEPVFARTTSGAATSLPIPFESLSYGRTYYWRAVHIDADGHPSALSAETSFTYGTPDTVPGLLVLNEILASNRDDVENGGERPDYIEIKNVGSAAISLDGYTLTDDVSLPGRFAFPAGITLEPGRHMVVWCDSAFSSSGLHTGFGLDADGETVLLMRGSTLVDSVRFGPQAPDVSIGRIVDGSGGWQANAPTPATANTAAALGSPAGLRVNEWMADPAQGEDWFEIHNTGGQVVSLAGLFLSDTPSTPTLTRIPALSFIEPFGFTRFHADGSTEGYAHAGFRLSKSGESLVLTAANGVTTLDSVTFSAQTTDASEGRLPDGAGTRTVFGAKTASPGRFNWAPAGPVINEVMAGGAAGQAVLELSNPTAQDIPIAGWYLSDHPIDRRKHRIPDGAVVPAGGYRTFTAGDLAGGPVPFALRDGGGTVILSRADASGALTGAASVVEYGAALPGRSQGRMSASGLGPESGGAEFWHVGSPTFGAANAAPAVGLLVITEIMYHPPDLAGGVDNARDEYIEVANAGAGALDLAGWALRGGSDFVFPSGIALAPGRCLLLVGFDPADAATLAAFRARYGIAASVPVLGPFSSKLANSAQLVEVARPAVLGGFSTRVATDRVVYRDALPWPGEADGGGRSLARISVNAIGNTASNWGAVAPTPGSVSLSVPLGLGDALDALRAAAGLWSANAGTLGRLDVTGDGVITLLDAARIAGLPSKGTSP